MLYSLAPLDLEKFIVRFIFNLKNISSNSSLNFFRSDGLAVG